MALPNLTIQNPETGEHISLQMSIQATDAASATKSEAFAVGERNGVPVESGDPTYQNNAKYYRDQMREIIDEAQTEGYINVVTAVADAYSASKTYNVGEYSIHDGKLYRCVVKITTAEAWTSAHWTQVNVGEDLSKTVWHEVQNLTAAQQSAARNNIMAADEVTVAFHTSQIDNLQFRKQDKLTFDSTPTAGSSNPVTSAGIKTVTDALAGDVSDLKSATSAIQEQIYIPVANDFSWERGTIASANGNPASNLARLRTTEYYDVPIGVTVDTGYVYSVLVYDTTSDPIDYKGLWNGTGYQTTPYTTDEPMFLYAIPKTLKVKILLLRTDNATMNISERSHLHVIAYTDTTLTTPECAADAKAVGDRFSEISEFSAVRGYTTFNGILKTDGTVAESSTLTIKKYTYTGEQLYLNGTGTYNKGGNYCYLWFVTNNAMTSYIEVTSKPQTFDYLKLNVPTGTDEIWVGNLYLALYAKSAVDKYARNEIAEIETQMAGYVAVGSQWRGKTWYAYGTSITANNGSNGRITYVSYLSQMSGLTAVNKGIGGGGIGNLGAFSTGQVYSAVCQTSDGKLNADLITLETGANDINAAGDIPLGTIYDTGTETLAGCLNDCIRYLQANTTAQIVVLPSPVSIAQNITAASHQYYTWAEMVEEICRVNRVHFIRSDNNMGYAKLTASGASDYIRDNIHQTDLGAYIMAQNIWYQLRNIPLFYTEIPT